MIISLIIGSAFTVPLVFAWYRALSYPYHLWRITEIGQRHAPTGSMCKALSTSSRFGKTTDTRITLPASNSCARLPHSVSAFTDCKHIHRGANPLLLSRIRTQNMFQPIWLGFFLGNKYWPCSTETAYWPRLFFIVEKESVLRCIIF